MMRNKNSGFTLVEVLLYVGIFSMLVMFVMGTLWSFGNSVSAGRSRQAVNLEADFVLQKITAALSGASALSEPATGASSTRLTLNRYGWSDNPIVFSLDSGAVWMQRGGGPAVRLTSSNVRADSLLFTHNPAVIARPESMQVYLALAASSSDSLASTSLRTTIYLRK